MFENEIKAIGLFFFLALLDERKAKAAASQAVDLFLQKMKKSPAPMSSVNLVLATKQIWDKTRGNFNRGRPYYTADSGWAIPDKLDLSPWKEFQKSAPEDEFLVCIWSQVLKIPAQDLSTALEITQGTIRYRLGRAFRKLGTMKSVSDRKMETVRP
jgi:hypothetical protein